MKNLIKFFMVMAVLCMTACSQTFEDVSNNAKPQEKGRLVMNVGSRSRTIMPTVDTLKSSIKSATLTANGTEIKSWSGSGIIEQIENEDDILLDVGIYNFEMKFYNGNNGVILSCTIDNQEIKTGNNKLTFDMKIAGNGNISITLSWVADSRINKIKAGLYNIDTGEAVKNYEPEELTISSDTYTTCYSKDNVQAGQYIIKFEVYDTSDKLLNTLTDVIEVIGGITTTHQIILNNINTQYYTITYELDGGNWQNGFIPITKRNANTKVTLPKADKINKTGTDKTGTDKTGTNSINYILVGWYDGNGDKITEISSGTTGDITVTAGWGITADTVATAIAELSGDGPHDIIVAGAITNDTISAIRTALTTLQTNNTGAKVNLDLSETNGLTFLNSPAFSGCSSLESVTIPDKVTTIGGYAFNGCSSLESVTIPVNVTSIGGSAFNGCSNLTSVTIPDSVTSIDGSAFKGCKKLTSVTIPAGVTTIGDNAFSGCSSLESVTIGNGVTSIGDAAFYDCKKLATVNYKGTEEEWNQKIIKGNNNKYLTDADRNYYSFKVTASEVSSKISGLGEGSYTIIVTGEILDTTISDIKGALTILQNNNTGAKVNLDLSHIENLTTLPDSAFQDCKNLTSVTIPDSVTSIGDSAFSGCSSLTTVNYKGTEKQWGEITGINQFVNVTINYYSFTVTAGEVSTEISKLTKGGSYTIIVTGEILDTTISDIKGALTILQNNNTGAKVNLDLSHIENLTTLPDSAFQDCKNLTSVTIPDSVTSIGNHAFNGCSLTSVTIPDSVTSIGVSAFYGCTGLTTVNYKGTEKQWGEITGINQFGNDVTINYYSFTVKAGEVSTEEISNLLAGGESYTIIVTGEISDTTAIKTALQKSNAKVNLDLSHIENLTGLPGSAFQDCGSLTSVTIGNRVTSIGNYAFNGCTGLTSVTIGNGVTSIGVSAFQNCGSLTSVTIGDNVTSIGDHAFNGCTHLTSVTIGNGVTSIGVAAFFGCTGLTSVTIGNSVTSIGVSAFHNCGSLTSVTIGNGVKEIGNQAFYGCSSLESVTIPAGVTSIGSLAFGGCTKLTTVNYKGTEGQWRGITGIDQFGNVTINYNYTE